MEMVKEKEYYFQESEEFFHAIKEETDYGNTDKNNENNETPFWFSRR